MGVEGGYMVRKGGKEDLFVVWHIMLPGDVMNIYTTHSSCVINEREEFSLDQSYGIHHPPVNDITASLSWDRAIHIPQWV